MGEPLVRAFVKEQKFGPLEAKLWMFQWSWVNGPCEWPAVLRTATGRRQKAPCAAPLSFLWTWQCQRQVPFFPHRLLYLLQPWTKLKGFTSLLLLVTGIVGIVFIVKLAISHLQVPTEWNSMNLGYYGILSHNGLAVVISVYKGAAVLYI